MAPYLSPDWVDALGRAVRNITIEGEIVVEQHVTGGPGGPITYHVRLGPDGGQVRHGGTDVATVRFEQDYATARAVATGALSAEEAFIRGRIRVVGDPSALIPHRAALAQIDDAAVELRQATEF